MALMRGIQRRSFFSGLFAAAALLAGCGDVSGEIAITVPIEAVDSGDPHPGDSESVPDASAGDVNAGEGGHEDGPVFSSCLEELDARHIGYTRTSARGVVDAVRLTGPINGVLFANGTATSTATDPMACEFVRTLHRFADVLKAHGFVRAG